MSETPLQVEVRQLSFRYGDTLVLDRVDLEVLKGDFTAIIGPNGSGKSTLIRLMLGLLLPSSGSVSIMGRPAAAFHDWCRVGYVPQKAVQTDPLFPASVRELVSMGLLSRKPHPRLRGRDGGLIEEALSVVGMERYAQRRIGELSGGQQQRVLIARALVSSPSLLILDEPTAGVDGATQRQFYDMLERINRERGITMVLVTHDIGVITRHVRKVACLNQRLVFHGTHEEFCSSGQIESLFGPEAHLICHSH